jgi:hypothetical protein
MNKISMKKNPLSEMLQMKISHSVWYIGCITALNDKCDILVKLIKREEQDTLTLSWPQREDKCHIPLFTFCV